MLHLVHLVHLNARGDPPLTLPKGRGVDDSRAYRLTETRCTFCTFYT